MIVPIRDQIAGVRAARDALVAALRFRVERGDKTEAEARTEIAACDAALASLGTIGAHAAGLRALIQYLRTADLQPGQQLAPEEGRYLLAQPGVRGTVNAYPDNHLETQEPSA